MLKALLEFTEHLANGIREHVIGKDPIEGRAIYDRSTTELLSRPPRLMINAMRRSTLPCTTSLASNWASRSGNSSAVPAGKEPARV